MKRNVAVAMEQLVALEMLQNLDSDDSGGGNLSEVESDTDLSWVNENTSSSSSSESDSEFIQRKRRRLSLKTTDPDVVLTPDCNGKLRCHFLLSYVMLWCPIIIFIVIVVLLFF